MLPVVDLTLQGAASMIRAGQLRFTPGEATALIRAHARDASAEDVQELQHEMGGWAAALVLGARTLRWGRESGVARSLVGPASRLSTSCSAKPSPPSHRQCAICC